MAGSDEYKRSMFDRHGAVAGEYIRAFSYGLMVFGLTSGVLLLQAGFKWWVIPVGLAAGALTGGVGLALANMAGTTMKHFTAGGSSTPYIEQYSFQQALVMQGELDKALESFEAVIVENPASASPRLKAAELYARDKKNFQRAAELFRDVQRIPTVTAGEDIYATNRLVDLLTGPLGDPGRALVELRRLIDRHPNAPAAAHARSALAELKARTTAAPD